MPRSAAPSSAAWPLRPLRPCSWCRVSTHFFRARRRACTPSTDDLLPKRPVRPREEPFMARAREAPSPKFYLSGAVLVVAAGLLVVYFHFAKSQEIAAVREARAAAAELGPRIEVVM